MLPDGMGCESGGRQTEINDHEAYFLHLIGFFVDRLAYLVAVCLPGRLRGGLRQELESVMCCCGFRYLR